MAETMSEETKQLVQSLLVGLDVETLRADALDLNVNKRECGVKKAQRE